MTPLTPRQVEILRAYGETGSYKLVAERLGVSRHTVSTTLETVRLRLGVKKTHQAVMRVFGVGQTS